MTKEALASPKDAALKLALEALEGFYEYGYDRQECFEHITAIKAALAQPTSGDYALGYVEGFNDACKPKPAQEPVAWMYVNTDGECEQIEYGEPFDDPGVTPLYTSPPQRKPLTDDEIWEFWCSRPEVSEGEDDSMEAKFVTAVRAVLAAHGIKEKNT